MDWRAERAPRQAGGACLFSGASDGGACRSRPPGMSATAAHPGEGSSFPRRHRRPRPSLLFDLKKVTMAAPQAARQGCVPAPPVPAGAACVRMIFSGGNPCELCSV
ncbi:hypothetical protein DESPIG_03080 [Desulfovibrio piger ATCC 29098]|uniref:Uncharacterized protein n=1 Tax=Desulfovibrio piger ATCC 29098 TaxID=411464 RepID=B6WY99_9BACT|nr:hypothetical protein DESPIG_03080 [Desulfovibrio piger ATCC 29098]